MDNIKDVTFKFSGKAQALDCDFIPTEEEVEKAIKELLLDEMGLLVDIKITDYAVYNFWIKSGD